MSVGRTYNRPTQFQFYDSPIKSAPGQNSQWKTHSFNSMIVRLKEALLLVTQESVCTVSIL